VCVCVTVCVCVCDCVCVCVCVKSGKVDVPGVNTLLFHCGNAFCLQSIYWMPAINP
jgi:hypothetical protein